MLYCYRSCSWISSAAITTLTAEVTEHKRADEHVWQLTISDPLAGLGNYRRLFDAFDSEVKTQGTGRWLAMLLPCRSDLVDVPASRA
jgi:hypothetical protein